MIGRSAVALSGSRGGRESWVPGDSLKGFSRKDRETEGFETPNLERFGLGCTEGPSAVCYPTYLSRREGAGVGNQAIEKGSSYTLGYRVSISVHAAPGDSNMKHIIQERIPRMGPVSRDPS